MAKKKQEPADDTPEQDNPVETPEVAQTPDDDRIPGTDLPQPKAPVSGDYQP